MPNRFEHSSNLNLCYLILCTFYATLIIQVYQLPSYGANRSRITYPSPFDEHHDNTFELIIIWPPSQTLKVLLHPVPNAYVSLRFHRFCCILYSAAVSVVLAPTSTFVVALLLHSTAILEASNSLLYPVRLVCMHNDISFPATIFCTATG